MAQVQWSNLPGEILHVIFQKLNDPGDIYRCGLVCVSWKSIVRTLLPHCLLLSNVDVFKDDTGRLHFGESLNKQSCMLFDTQTNETHEISLPQVEGRWFRSSSFGWLLTIDFKAPHQIRLLNPFTSDQIELPSAKGFNRPAQLRVITSTSPLDLRCSFLAVQHGKLAFCRPGDESWTEVRYFESFCSDAIFYKDKFYAVDSGGDLYRISCNIIPIAAKLPLRSILLPEEQFRQVLYLVELDGNLLLVARNRFRTDQLSMANVFQVFELNWVEKEWSIRKSIGNNTILLGRNSSIALSVSSSRNFKANCIYFIDDNIPPIMNELLHYNTGFYDMMAGHVEYLYQSSDIWTSPLNWFIPALPDIYTENTSEDICKTNGAGEKSWSSKILASLQSWFRQKLEVYVKCFFIIIFIYYLFLFLNSTRGRSNSNLGYCQVG